MTSTLKLPESKPSLRLSILIFVLAVGLMAWLRLYLFPDRFITLPYGLPLLVCLFHRDRRLLWTMAVTFTVMAYYKAFYVLPNANPSDHWITLQWLFQVVNIIVVTASVHVILRFGDALRAKNLALEEANHELQAQAEELAQQNEEIQRQAEEISNQNEELQQQNEELQQQGEELEAQSEELQTANAELSEREGLLQHILKTAAINNPAKPALDEICEMLLALMGRTAQSAVVCENKGGELVIRAHRGLAKLERDHWPSGNSLAAVAMEHKRTASIHDLRQRPDLIVPHAPNVEVRSSLAAPLRVAGEIVGVIELHSTEPHAWTARQFELIEWAASQCGLMLEVTRLRDELSASNKNLEALVTERTAELQELVAELEHFSYTITHDMRAPLRALQGFAAMLMSECQPLNHGHADYLNRIIQAAERMDRLITDALSYSEAVRFEQPPARVDTMRLLEGILATYPKLQPPHAEIEILGPLPPVLANEAGLTQCLSNLLSNAVKFVAPGQQPRVVVRAETSDGLVRLCVEDNGIGIPEDFQPRVFEMFQRASKAYDGTGIGLALVRKVSERMGGRVGVKSSRGEGSKFWIELKAATETHAMNSE